VEASDLTVNRIHQRRGHAVIDDRVEPDLREGVAQLGCGAVEHAGFTREIGAKIDNWDRVGVGHSFS
jgi:hypothetical protein